jgi:hypothetical protein
VSLFRVVIRQDVAMLDPVRQVPAGEAGFEIGSMQQ